MNIFITGGLGFVGRHLSTALVEDGHRVTAVGRTENPDKIDHPDFHYIAADTTQAGDWQKSLADHDVVINLAGKSIFTVWTEKIKQQIYDSRILTTRNLVAGLPEGRETLLCSTSAVGYYGDGGEEVLTEDAPPGDDFLAQVGRDWEKEALAAEAKGARVVLPRFGIVLDRDGGALATMIPAFRSFVGGSLAPLGGQNFLEPLMCGVMPTIGPSWKTFQWVGDDLFRQQLVHVAEDAHQAADFLLATLAAPPPRPAVQNALADYVTARRGGTAMAAAVIERFLRGSLLDRAHSAGAGRPVP